MRDIRDLMSLYIRAKKTEMIIIYIDRRTDVHGV